MNYELNDFKSWLQANPKRREGLSKWNDVNNKSMLDPNFFSALIKGDRYKSFDFNTQEWPKYRSIILKWKAEIDKNSEKFNTSSAQEWLDQNYPLEKRKETVNLVIDSKRLVGSLNLSTFPNLRNLSCFNNKLTELNVSKCKLLLTLSCSRNQLSSLDLRNQQKLEYLVCEDNKLSSLDLSANLQLKSLKCDTDLRPLQQLYNTLKFELDQKQDQLTKIQTDYQTINQQLETIQKEVKSPENLSVPEKVKFFNNWVKKVKKDKQELEKNIQNEKKEAEKIRRSLDSTMTKLKDQEKIKLEEVQQLNQTNQQLKRALIELDVKLQTERQKVLQLEAENNKMKSELQTTQEELSKDSWSKYWKGGGIAVLVVVGVGFLVWTIKKLGWF